MINTVSLKIRFMTEVHGYFVHMISFLPINSSNFASFQKSEVFLAQLTAYFYSIKSL
jgi:hypothetical protein